MRPDVLDEALALAARGARAATEPTVEPSSAFTAFVLEQIRCAKLRAQMIVNQCEMTITALSAGLITPEAAILILAETGVEVSS